MHSFQPLHRLVSALGLSACSLCLFTAGGHAATEVFQNGSSMSIPPGGLASPYPSRIKVTGMSGEIIRVRVGLSRLTHINPDDLDILLVAPDGSNVLLMSDAGGTDDMSASLVFEDGDFSFLPDRTRITSGTYRPTDYGFIGDTFPNVDAGPRYGNKLSGFNGATANGTWDLFVVDDLTQIGAPGGSMLDWLLEITTTNFPPRITQQPQDQSVAEGAPAQFRVVVTGTSPFAYQWTHNGRVLVPFGQGTDTLFVPQVSLNNVGGYSVNITNLGAPFPGVTSRTATLSLSGPPVIEEFPKSVVTQPGANVTFRVEASGPGPIFYQWRRNGIWLTGQTDNVLTLTEVLTSDGGNYSVVVWNNDGAVTVPAASLEVEAPTGPEPTDEFFDRPFLEGDRGVLQGNSRDATIQEGEPVPFGGGKSVWFQWFALDDGIVEFTTLGSAFDTILTVYRGEEFEQLERITGDDDRAGFYNSSFQFNAIRGEIYQIQLDGFAFEGKGGPFTVSWQSEKSDELVPVARINPVDISITPGGTAVFAVELEEQPPFLEPPTFQWLFDGEPIDGANESKLILERATSADIGFYSVLIQNQFQRRLITPAVTLQFGFPPGFLVNRKSQAMFLTSGGGEFVPIGMGSSVFNQSPWTPLPEEGDPNPCGSPFFGTLWQGLAATNSGRVEVSTVGSGIFTRLAVYHLTGTPADFLGGNPPLICDLTSAGAGLPCIVEFDAAAGSNYTVVVEGFMSSGGTIQVNSTMGGAPAPPGPPSHCLVALSGTHELTAPTNGWFPAPAVQWRLGDVDLLDATNSTLTVDNFSVAKQGLYSVVLSNFVDTVTYPIAHLALSGPLVLDHSWVSVRGSRSFVVRGSNAAPFAVQTRNSFLAPWTTVATHADPCSMLNFTNTTPSGDSQRFYRAAPWSPP